MAKSEQPIKELIDKYLNSTTTKDERNLNHWTIFEPLLKKSKVFNRLLIRVRLHYAYNAANNLGAFFVEVVVER